MNSRKQKKDETSSERSKVYETLLSLLELSPEHIASLKSRGFSPSEIKALNYRTYPASRSDIARRLREKLKGRLPEDGVPGIWKNAKGEWELAGKAGIAIPIRGLAGEITGIKIRADKPSTPASKYLLLSSNPKPDARTGEVMFPSGAAAKITIHYPLDRPAKVKTLRITEGEIKADVATMLTSEYTISLPGVNSWRLGLESVRVLHPARVLLSFDSDKEKEFHNEYATRGTNGKGSEDSPLIVGKSLASLYLALKEEGVEVAIEDWPPDAGKGIDDVLVSGSTDKITLLEGAEADEWARGIAEEGMQAGWVYVVGVKRFYHTVSLLELDKEQFADRYCHEEKGNPAMNALRNTAFPKADLPIYAPTREPIFIEEGTRYFNTWRPNRKVLPVKGEVRPFLDHAAYILPDERERTLFLDWLSYTVQFPGRKILWAMLLQGQQGTGKSYFGYLMRLLLGEKNISMPTNDLIHEIYTAWQKSCQLVIIEELMARGRMELMNKLKPMITQTTTMVREMQKPAYEQPNVFNLLMFTNHEDAILLDEQDRRYCVLYSPAKPRPPEYYDRLWNWTKDNASALLYYMLHRSLAHFEPRAHAPMTDAKRALIRESVPALQAWIGEAIETGAWPFMSDIACVQHLLECIPGSLKGFASPQAIGKALRACGAVSLGQVALKSGAAFRLWSVRRHEIWASAGKESIAAEYERWAAITREPGGNPMLEARPL